MSIFYPYHDIGSKTQVFSQVLDQIEKTMNSTGLEYRDVNDSTFFKIAVEKCFHYSENAKFVHRLHDILMKDNNIKFLSNEDSHKKYL